MDGISESEFFDFNSYLYDCLKKYYMEEKDESIDKNTIKSSILFAANNLIDNSNGFINTENENIKELFARLFNIVASIKRYSQYLEHCKSEIRKCKNDDKLEDIATQLSMTSALLKNTYNKAYEITEEIKQYKSSKLK